MQYCKKCIYNQDVPNIIFNNKGICNYCLQIEELKGYYKTGTDEGKILINKIIKKIKKDGNSLKYDCVIGISGGTDSSYLLHWAKENGLRPLAVHYDNTWNSTIATQNIRKITTGLNVDLYTHVVNNKEMDDIYRAFIKACVPAIDVPTDLALTEIMYRAASKYNIKYILEGHSFLAEGISPTDYSYFDGKYIESVHKLYGSMPMITFPNMKILKFIYWVIFKRIKKIRPLWYIEYSKSDAIKILNKNYGWEYYGGHHLENIITAFSHSYHNPRKFNIDQRNNSIAAMVRTGEIDREEGIKIYSKSPKIDPNIISYTIDRLEFEKSEFKKIMDKENKNWYDYPSSKKTFEKLRPLFFILSKYDLVPMSFYLKYCFPINR
tara:strand:- start:717 stop:1853 length:1137 start_codon:yes stop_codon:yes gene_type:complete